MTCSVVDGIQRLGGGSRLVTGRECRLDEVRFDKSMMPHHEIVAGDRFESSDNENATCDFIWKRAGLSFGCSTAGLHLPLMSCRC